MIDLSSSKEVSDYLSTLAKERGIDYVLSKITSTEKRYYIPVEMILEYKDKFTIDILKKHIDFSYWYSFYSLIEKEIIDRDGAKEIINYNLINNPYFQMSISYLKYIYDDIRGDSIKIADYMTKYQVDEEFLLCHIDILNADIINFQSISESFIKENINLIPSSVINDVLGLYSFDEEYVREHHNPDGEYPLSFFLNQNLSREFLHNIKSKNNKYCDESEFEERFFNDESYGSKLNSKSEIERHFTKFRQYLIYAYERVDCVDDTYSSDGAVIYVDDVEYDDADDFMEMLREDERLTIDKSKEFYFLNQDDINDINEKWDEMDDSEKWEFLDEYCRNYYDDANYVYYRYERSLRNVCFSHKEAVKLVEKYSSERRAYYQQDSIINDDIYKLQSYFRGLN